MTFNYGVFINTMISFVIVAFAVFLLVRAINRLKREEEAKPAEPPRRRRRSRCCARSATA